MDWGNPQNVAVSELLHAELKLKEWVDESGKPLGVF
jgi:hypothetical protein